MFWTDSAPAVFQFGQNNKEIATDCPQNPLLFQPLVLIATKTQTDLQNFLLSNLSSYQIGTWYSRAGSLCIILFFTLSSPRSTLGFVQISKCFVLYYFQSNYCTPQGLHASLRDLPESFSDQGSSHASTLMWMRGAIVAATVGRPSNPNRSLRRETDTIPL